MRLDVDASRARFATAKVARLASADADGRPHIVPITFAVLGDDRIVTAVDQKPKSTPNLRRLRNIRVNPRVSVLADHYSDDWDELWWVRADGRASILEKPDGRCPALSTLAEKYPQYRDDPPRGPVIEILVDAWTGWLSRP